MLPKTSLQRAVEVAATSSGVAAGEVSFAFVDEATMCRHHERFCGDPSPTDVLSFPGNDDAEPGYLGDVIVCADLAASQARGLGHSYRTELAVLALHGVLHLLGHDHMRDQGEMRLLEERLLPRVLCAWEP